MAKNNRVSSLVLVSGTIGTIIVLGAVLLCDEDLNRRAKQQISQLLDNTEKVIKVYTQYANKICFSSGAYSSRISSVESQWDRVENDRLGMD